MSDINGIGGFNFSTSDLKLSDTLLSFDINALSAVSLKTELDRSIADTDYSLDTRYKIEVIIRLYQQVWIFLHSKRRMEVLVTLM